MTEILFSLTVKISVLMAVVLGVMPLLRTRSAALRHGVLAAAVACAVALPLLEAVVPSWSIELPVPPGMPAQMESPQHVAAGAASVTATVDPTTTPAASSRAWRSPEAAQQIVGATWLAGVSVSLIALLVGLARLARLARRATPMADAVWVHSLTDIARSVGLHRPVRLLQSDHPALLAAWGWWTPTVMVPRSARDWPDRRIRIVLCHELAHLRRGDWLAQMGAELLRAACWFNPLVWILRNRLRFESERACDDAVLDRECDAADYATHLVEIARTLASPRRSASSLPVSAMARSAGLERRVSAMLHPHVDRRPLSRTHRLAIATTLLALTCTIAGAVTAAQALSSFAGTVLDPTDRVLPNVRVVLTDPANQSKHEVRSDASGRFEFAGVSAGDYALEAFLPGFATLRGQVTVTGGGPLETNVRMEVGSIEETVTVASSGRPEPARVPSAAEMEAAARALQSKRGVGDCPGSGAPGDVGGNLRAPRKVKNVPPVYPEALSLQQVSGRVELKGVIGVDGTMRELRAASSDHADFERAALDAVRQWEFDTTLLNCQPIEVNIGVHVNFDIRP